MTDNTQQMVTMLDQNGNPGQVSADKVQAAQAAGYKLQDVRMTSPTGEQGYVSADKVSAARQSNYAVSPQAGVKPMVTPDGQLTYALPNEVDQFVSSGHTALNNDGTLDQNYQYAKYGLDVKGKISPGQLRAAMQYDTEHGNYVPSPSDPNKNDPTEGYTPSDDILNQMGVDPTAFRNNKKELSRRTQFGDLLPSIDEHGNIRGGSKDFNAVRALRTGLTAIPATVSQIGHAFYDDPKTPEEASRPTGTLGIHRVLIDPNVDLLQKSAASFREGNVSDGLAHALGGILPIVGPMAHSIADGLVNGDGNERAEAVGNLLAIAGGDKVMGVAGDLTKEGISTGVSKLANTAGRITPAVIGGVAKVAGKTAALAGRATGSVIKAGAPYVGDYVGGLADSLTSGITDKISDLTSGTASDAMDAMRSIRNTAMQKLADNGITGENATHMVNDLLQRVPDMLSKLSPKADLPDVGDNVQWRSGGNDQFDALKTITGFTADRKLAFLNDGATPVPADELIKANSPEEALKINSPKEQAGSAGIVADSILKTGSDSNPSLWTKAGGLQGITQALVDRGIGIEAAKNLAAKFAPNPSEFIGSDIKDWANSWKDKLNAKYAPPVPDDATAISKAANTEAGQGLKAVATPGQMAGGALSAIEKIVRKTGHGVGQYIADKYDVPARAAAEQSLNKAIDNVSPETAGMSQAERIAPLDEALPKVNPEEAMPLDGQQLGGAFLRMGLTGKMGDALTPDLAFSHMRSMSTSRFLNILAKAKESAPVVRQGFVRYLADTTKDPTTGAYHLGKMSQLIKENYGKLGTDAPEFKTLGDGLAELEQHIKLSNTQGRSLVSSVIGSTVAGIITVIATGGDPIRTAGWIAAEALAYKYGAKLGVDLLMKPRNVADLNTLFRVARTVPEDAIDDKKFKQAAAAVKKNVVNPLMNKINDAYEAAKDKTVEAIKNKITPEPDELLNPIKSIKDSYNTVKAGFEKEMTGEEPTGRGFGDSFREGIKNHQEAQILKETPLANDPQASKYVNDIGDKLGIEAPLKVVEGGVARAGMGGIYVPKELIDQLSEPELAGVIAHESAHIELGHTGLLKGNLAKIPAYSRSLETAADKVVVNKMKEAGYDPNAYVTGMEKIWADTVNKAKQAGMTVDDINKMDPRHPPMLDRIANAKQAVPVNPGKGETITPGDPEDLALNKKEELRGVLEDGLKEANKLNMAKKASGMTGHSFTGDVKSLFDKEQWGKMSKPEQVAALGRMGAFSLPMALNPAKVMALAKSSSTYATAAVGATIKSAVDRLFQHKQGIRGISDWNANDVKDFANNLPPSLLNTIRGSVAAEYTKNNPKIVSDVGAAANMVGNIKAFTSKTNSGAAAGTAIAGAGHLALDPTNPYAWDAAIHHVANHLINKYSVSSAEAVETANRVADEYRDLRKTADKAKPKPAKGLLNE